ncbi:MAG: DUF4157 domain-containing protein [Bacteroidales bacterium]|nr:DUF4157 domain-containing protein [Bacteroidales bacterium]
MDTKCFNPKTVKPGTVPERIIQPKLEVNPPNDIYEKQADEVADRVSRMPANPSDNLQMQPKEDEEKKLQMKSEDEESISMQPEEEEKGKIQMSIGNSSGNQMPQVSSSLASQLQSTKGQGSPLSDGVRQEMGQKIGGNFNNVRVHTDDNAVQMSKEIGAKAFTHGNDIYFNSGKYNPDSFSGKHLLTHELTHTIQQGGKVGRSIQRKIGDGHDLKSPRFALVEDLESVYDSEKSIEKGATGDPVRIIQQALLDTGQTLPIYGVDGKFEVETETAVTGFQTAQGLATAIKGKVDDKTMESLDTYFLDYSHMAELAKSMNPPTNPTKGTEYAKGKAPAELYKGTRALDPSEKTYLEYSRTTEVKAPIGGVLPTFNEGVPPDDYTTKVDEVTKKTIDFLYDKLGKGKAVDHADPAKLHDWKDIENLALLAKIEVDKVFGKYVEGNAFVVGTNLFDGWEDKEAKFTAGGASFEQDSVEWRVNKIFSGSTIGTIDQKYGAVQSRPKEKGILDGIRTKYTTDPTYRTKLIEIHKGWPGYADPTTQSIYLQRFKSADNAENREFMWRTFQTCVHEYIHTLEHSGSDTYRSGLGEMKGGKTFREGMTEYFTHIVLSNVTYDAAFRKKVEGSFNDPLIVHPIPKYTGYAEAKNAEKIAGLVGLRNVMAAYFLGDTKFVGDF